MLQVECYANHRGEQTPRVMHVDGRKVFVEELLDTWLGQDHRYYKLKGDDGDVYVIRYNSATNTWELTTFRRAT